MDQIFQFAGTIGLEPTTLGLTGHRSTLLKLHPHLVAQVGLEPTPLSGAAFETAVYTNSTTEPYLKKS